MLHLAASLPRPAAGRFKKPVLSTGTENYFSPAILFALGLAAGASMALATPLFAGVPVLAGVILVVGLAAVWRGPDRFRRLALLAAVFAAGLLAGQMRTEARIAGVHEGRGHGEDVDRPEDRLVHRRDLHGRVAPDHEAVGGLVAHVVLVEVAARHEPAAAQLAEQLAVEDCVAGRLLDEQ